MKQPKDKFNLSNDEYYMPKQGKNNKVRPNHKNKISLCKNKKESIVFRLDLIL